MGAYALFSAQKIDVVYSKVLFEYLEQNALMISDARTCYAAMCFTLFSKLKMKEKFGLCQLLEKKVVEYRLEDIYNEIFTMIVDEASKSKNLKKNVFVLSSGRVEKINIINGYICGRKYSDLLYNEGKDFMSDLKELIYTIYRNSEVKEQLKSENKKMMTFMDCFIRECFEYQISENPDLISNYDRFIPLFEEDVVVGPFLRKNFTCAAGNYFSRHGKYTLYRKKYINLVQTLYNRREKRYKETALFLIINSRQDELTVDGELYKILKKILRDPWMQKHFEEKEDVKFWMEKGKIR